MFPDAKLVDPDIRLQYNSHFNLDFIFDEFAAISLKLRHEVVSF